MVTRKAVAKRNRPDPESHPRTTLRRVNWSEDLDVVHRFFSDYRQWVADHQEGIGLLDSGRSDGLDMIDAQIAGLPGAYGPPHGEVLLAFDQEAIVACGALRELEPKVAEIKRLYVRADHRGGGFGKRLTSALLERARELGYERVRVDTLSTMAAAIQFYQELGFRPIPSYWAHPAPGALFFEYRVSQSSGPPRRPGATKSKRPRK
ncbi:MAG: GNAT family N-acetyltransferase [Thermoplasmata archaeon]